MVGRRVLIMEADQADAPQVSSTLGALRAQCVRDAFEATDLRGRESWKSSSLS